MRSNPFFCLRLLCAFFLLFTSSLSASASHIVGGDLYYTHISGSTYKITLALYGDCGPASAGAFATLPSGAPVICIYDGGTYVTTLNLSIESPTTGTEITPLCSGVVSQCVNPSSTTPAIKKFTYSTMYTLPHTSSVWRFIFNGAYGPSSAGRAAAITNIASAGSTIMQLTDTLNNAGYNNSSPSLLVSQSTFFCLNDYNNYNPMASDPDGDALAYALIDATSATTTCTSIGSAVSYVSADAWPGVPLSGTNPIKVAAGTYSFNNTDGQLSFFPNTLQRAVVVYNIREYRGGVLVGTSQREMTVLVTGSCSSVTPCSGMPSAGTYVYDSVCSAADTLTLTGYSCAGVTMQWEWSADGATWSIIAGATGAECPTASAPGPYYRCHFVCISSGQSAYSGIICRAAGTAGNLSVLAELPSGTSCSAVNFEMKACSMSSGGTIRTYFGDGTSALSGVLAVPAVPIAYLTHNYSFPGTYTIKHVLYSGTSAIDSVSYPLTYNFCFTRHVQFYTDNNSNCVYDAGDNVNFLPVTTEIDSNGVPLDTVVATGGFYYTCHGGPGTVYTYRVIGTSPGLTVTCPATAVLTDVAGPTSYLPGSLQFGLQCTGASVFDLSQLVSFRAGRHMGLAHIVVMNAYCAASGDSVSMSYSPDYTFTSSFPAPAAVYGNHVKWALPPLSATSGVFNINASFHESTVWLTPGDTVASDYTTYPVTGDIAPTNNVSHRIDTVFSSWDPNAISVSPEGYIAAGTELTYTIDFENMGNAPAENIHILDTLSEHLIPGSIQVTGASAAMNLIISASGGYTVVKFDFPGINLPDSSHHNECHGMVVFKAKNRTGLPPGTLIPARAGIYFDDNEVVMTNTVTNIINIPSIVTSVDRENVIIYPNPATSEVSILAASDTYDEAIITNTVGQIMVQKDLSGSTNILDIQSLKPGMYYVTLRGRNGTTTGKFLKL